MAHFVFNQLLEPHKTFAGKLKYHLFKAYLCEKGQFIEDILLVITGKSRSRKCLIKFFHIFMH
jgi:hypothetical protein